MKKVKAEELQKGDKVVSISGNTEIVETVLKRNKYCLIMFENGLSFHIKCNEEIELC